MSNDLEMKRMVDFLNYLLSIDPSTVTRLFNKRVITSSKKLINHSKIVLAESIRSTFDEEGNVIDEKTFYQLGMLGLLNGAYYNNKENVIAAIFHPKYKNGKVIKNFDIINMEELKKYEQDSD